MIISWFLIDYQLSKSIATEHWWSDHPRIALGFRFLSCIDLEALNVITSKCASHNRLNARLTDEGKKKF